ncbi:MAG: hypothetical protein GX804_00720 [Lentisphaerae bacterium]|nr:hypothetical protein [Lentisphaerota bacterium]
MNNRTVKPALAPVSRGRKTISEKRFYRFLNRSIRCLAAAYVLAFVTGCATCPLCGSDWRRAGEVELETEPQPDLRKLSGTVSCIERVAVLPTFEVKVRLTRLDVAPQKQEIVKEESIKGFNDFPVPFELEYDRAKLNVNGSYGLVAELVSQGSVLFRTDTQYRVSVEEEQAPLDLIIVRTTAD